MRKRKTRKPIRSCSAFTLTETVMSLPIAGIALVALYACFTQGFTMVQQSRENLRATQIMLKQLERIRICPFDQLTNTVFNPQSLTDYFDPADLAGGNGGATYTVTFKPSMPASGVVPDSYRTNILLITVGITWNSGRLQHTNFMQTLVARNGIEGYVATGQSP